MCGIYGAVAFTDSGKASILAKKDLLIESSKLRGRDGSGIYEWDWGYLGVSRAQPLPEAEAISLPLCENKLVMVFNGTLSNDRELADEYGFRRETVDTFTAIRLWSLLGWKCCNQFIGGFAFGVYDAYDDEFIVAKNFKTLWYVRNKDFFIFASEKRFLLFDWADCEFDILYPRRFPQNTVVGFNRYGGLSTDKIERRVWSYTPELSTKKAVVVVSGGIDSVTSAHIARSFHGKEITLLHFDYGQRSREREKEAVENVAKSLGCPLQVVDLSLLGSWGKSPLTDWSIPLPLGERSVESTLCWVPARNMLMVSYAAAYAEVIGAKWIYYGNNMEEEATGYADNDLEFIYLYNQLLDYGTLRGVKIKRALGRLMKAEILQVGAYLGVDYAKTWSCDEGFNLPCGVCGCCTTRRQAFKRAGMKDRQKYMKPLDADYPWTEAASYDIEKLLRLVEEEEVEE